MAGRPTAYKPEYVDQVFKLCLLGLTDAQMADIFGIAGRTFNNWKDKYPEFMQSIKKGKEPADAEVAVSLRNRALGYSHPEEKIFIHEGKPIRVKTTKHYPPDTAAAFIWLKNRQPKIWRDKVEIDLDTEATPTRYEIVVIDGTKDDDTKD